MLKEKNIKSLHRLSGIFILSFVALHLVNHLGSVLGAEVHIAMMDAFRLVYRNIFVETLLILAILLQVYSGIKLFLKNRKTAETFFQKLQLRSGLYLAFFFLFHTSAVFGGRLVLGLDTNFYFGVSGLNIFPFYLFFVPYYGLAILAVFAHIAAIHSYKMQKELFGLSPIQQSKLILGIGFVFLCIVFYGLTNGFAGVELPEAYNVLIGK